MFPLPRHIALTIQLARIRKNKNKNLTHKNRGLKYKQGITCNCEQHTLNWLDTLQISEFS
jgi:hypothetical protein